MCRLVRMTWWIILYAATKKSNELFAHCYSKLYDIPTTGLCFFTVYGPAGRPDMAYFGFTRPVNYSRWRNVRSVTSGTYRTGVWGLTYASFV